MGIYLFSLILGAVGLVAMAVTGLGRHTHGGGSHVHGTVHGHGGAQGHGQAFSAGARLGGWLLMSPRLFFAALLGFGMIGIALQTVLGGFALVLAAIAGGIAVERLLVNPLWKFAMRFASNPATTLASATMGEGVAVSNFDRNGQGIIAIEVDGHVQQVLATLQAADRAAGVRVRAGQTVRIAEVDEARQRCVVTKL